MGTWESLKIMAILNYTYGIDAAGLWKLDSLTYEITRGGRIRRIRQGDLLYSTVRSDGSLALTLEGIKPLTTDNGFTDRYGVFVDEASEDEVKRGNSVFAGHIVRAGADIRPRMDVPIMNKRGSLIAVGRAVISGQSMMAFKKGVAVKVRDHMLPKNG
ncbi:MAG: queuine tRNA-ribosyltransferase [Nitrososphaerota archaeon]|nr:queuine tRNA-ribosyltransferase [Nitrososphaerota archaeon]MDG7048569.1 queuine tRNA-ribosyltransferase [Nitrososphaerota archaeon]MDG7051099.1 queuine tRNA-ribosyltransferase [Nitrososphaerota archaeon]